jgi:hypothetical protein
MMPPLAGRLVRNPWPAINHRHIDDERLNATLSLIAASAHIDHSGTSLWNHLLGTFEILRAWGAGTEVCFAGLIHSIYATQYVQTAIVAPPQRRWVASIVGERTERLTHLFCVVDRQTIWEAAVPPLGSTTTARLREHRSGAMVRVSRDTLRSLRLIDLANELEQSQRNAGPPTSWLGRVCAGFRSIGFVPSHLTTNSLMINDRGERRLLRHYGEAVRAPRERARRLLMRCIAEVPRCAEPRLLLATIQLAEGDAASAYQNARAGLDDLRGWAVAWDTRAPLLAWELMGSQLIQAARYGTREPPAIAKQILQRLRRASGPR